MMGLMGLDNRSDAEDVSPQTSRLQRPYWSLQESGGNARTCRLSVCLSVRLERLAP